MEGFRFQPGRGSTTSVPKGEGGEQLDDIESFINSKEYSQKKKIINSIVIHNAD
jgi:hypothetical protein